MSDQTIFRAPREPGAFFQADKHYMESDLPMDAKAVMTYLLMKPDDWVINIKDIRLRMHCGRDRAYRCIGDLVEAGYMERYQTHNQVGTAYHYKLYERPTPVVQETKTGIPGPENQDLVFRTHTKNDSTKNDSTKNVQVAGAPESIRGMGMDDAVRAGWYWHGAVWGTDRLIELGLMRAQSVSTPRKRDALLLKTGRTFYRLEHVGGYSQEEIQGAVEHALRSDSWWVTTLATMSLAGIDVVKSGKDVSRFDRWLGDWKRDVKEPAVALKKRDYEFK